MIVYEVNLDVDADIFVEYRAWLTKHVQAMLALPGFVSAEILERRDPPPASQQRCLCVQYRLVDAAALDRYLREDAPKMRADGQARFGGQFNASRRILSSIPSH
jgi:quinol monooxygenase YgiN